MPSFLFVAIAIFSFAAAATFVLFSFIGFVPITTTFAMSAVMAIFVSRFIFCRAVIVSLAPLVVISTSAMIFAVLLLLHIGFGSFVKALFFLGQLLLTVSLVVIVVPLLIVASRGLAMTVFLVPLAAAALVAVASMPFSVVFSVSYHCLECEESSVLGGLGQPSGNDTFRQE